MKSAILAALFATTASADAAFEAAWKLFYGDATEITRAQLEASLNTSDPSFKWAIANQFIHLQYMYDLNWDFLTRGKGGDTLSKAAALESWTWGSLAPSTSADSDVVFGTLDYN